MNSSYTMKKTFLLPVLAFLALSLTGCESENICAAFNGLDADSQSALIDYFPTLLECGNGGTGIVVDGDTIDTSISGIVVDGAG